MPIFKNRQVKGTQRSTAYRVLQMLPTRARPLLLAMDAIAVARERRMQSRFNKRESQLLHEIDRAKHPKRGGMGLGRLLFAAGLTFVAAQIARSQKGQLRSTPLMNSPVREKTPTSK